jgi:glyoxylase-like metal-dependent hydrolase (beta-lactamase superfamily II)
MALAVNTYQLGPIGTNCYVVRAGPDAPEAVVVDPGGAGQLGFEIAGMGARCAAILLTHTHFDHIGGVAQLAQDITPVFVSPDAAGALESPIAPPGVTITPYEGARHVAGGETLDVAGISFEVLDVPGHAPGHLAFAADDSLFSGDVLFAGGVGRVDLPGGDWETLLESIRMLAERFPPDTTVYSGHGPATTLGAELARNPFLAELRAAQQ